MRGPGDRSACVHASREQEELREFGQDVCALVRAYAARACPAPSLERTAVRAASLACAACMPLQPGPLLAQEKFRAGTCVLVSASSRLTAACAPTPGCCCGTLSALPSSAGRARAGWLAGWLAGRLAGWLAHRPRGPGTETASSMRISAFTPSSRGLPIVGGFPRASPPASPLRGRGP